MDSVYLQGAEDVRSAAHTMRHASDDMVRAADTISSAIGDFQRTANELVISLDRHREVIERASPEEEKPDRFGQLLGVVLLVTVIVAYATIGWIGS